LIKPEPKDLKFGRTWLKPVLGELSQKFFLCQNRTGGSLEKEEQQNTGNKYWDPN
jgi:hypothetical protein